MKKVADPSSDPLAGLLGYHLRRASVVAIADLTKSLAPFGLTPAEASALFIIGANAGLTQSEVGRMLGILRANMAPLMAAFVSKGWVLRTQVDGRSQALRLSAAGEALRRQAWSATEEHEQRLFGRLSQAVRHKLVAQLHGLWTRGNKPAERA